MHAVHRKLLKQDGWHNGGHEDGGGNDGMSGRHAPDLCVPHAEAEDGPFLLKHILTLMVNIRIW